MSDLSCLKCGAPLLSGTCDRCTSKAVSHIVHRDIVLLIILSALVVPLFMFTRSMAARNRIMNMSIARQWYLRGQEQLRSGNTAAAVESFRNAATNDHNSPEYMLALATALEAAGHTIEARQTLLRLRERSPEDGEINLELARLEAKAEQHDSAVRYYHHAIFGTWRVNDDGSRRSDVRKELIAFLLDIQDKSQALAELLILSSESPDTDAAHNDVGRLFLAAGDSRHAFEQFTRTLQHNNNNATALDGAGEASFNLGEYAKARRYLESAVKNGSQNSKILLEITNLVLAKDPLGSTIRNMNRIERLREDMNFVSDELAGCLFSKEQDPSSLVILEPLRSELVQARESRFVPTILRNDPEQFVTALNLIHRIETATGDICGEASPLHRALILIAAKHGAVEQ